MVVDSFLLSCYYAFHLALTSIFSSLRHREWLRGDALLTTLLSLGMNEVASTRIPATAALLHGAPRPWHDFFLRHYAAFGTRFRVLCNRWEFTEKCQGIGVWGISGECTMMGKIRRRSGKEGLMHLGYGAFGFAFAVEKL